MFSTLAMLKVYEIILERVEQCNDDRRFETHQCGHDYQIR